MNKLVLLLLILLIGLSFPFFWKMTNIKFSFIEKFNNLGSSPVSFNRKDNNIIQKRNAKFPISSSNVLVKESYPITGRKCIGNDSAYQIWWHYPIFEVGSYEQITNNIRYNNNPDTGNCMPADFCGSLYKEFQTKGNYVYPLPPVKPKCGSRVNYYYTPTNMLPYKNEANILY